MATLRSGRYQVSVMLSPGVYEALEEELHRRRIPRSEVVEEALSFHLAVPVQVKEADKS